MCTNIACELEKTVHILKSKRLKVFRENRFPVSKDQWLILQNISEKKGCNQSEIAQAIFKEPAAITRMIDTLVNKGFVRRKSTLKDRRVFKIELTVEGNRLVRRMTPELEEIETGFESRLSKRQKHELIDLLQALQG